MRRGRHIHTYRTNAEFEEAYKGSYYHEPWVSYTKSDDRVDYNMSEEERKLRTPLTFDFISSGNVMWYSNNNASTLIGADIYYKLNSGEWTQMPVNTPIAVSSGDTMQFKGDNPKYAIFSKGSTADTHYAFFCPSGQTAATLSAGTPAKFNARGNIMSLIDSENFSTLDHFSAGTVGNIERLFSFSGIVDASGLIFPVKNLTVNCCRNMFCDCQWITVPMDMSRVETLANYCFNGMFMRDNTDIWGSGVPDTGLTPGADYLPWTTLAEHCYGNMFNGCIRLHNAPDLPAETLAASCYNRMFVGCETLQSIKCLAINPSETYFQQWVAQTTSSQNDQTISSSGVLTVYDRTNSYWDTKDISHVPKYWTVEDA